MIEATLYRTDDSAGATFGRLFLHGIQQPDIWTLEDTWKDNKRNISCIPTGRYLCKPHGWEPNNPFKFKQVWEVTDVPGRSAILLHIGNTSLDTQGCILLGLNYRRDDRAILESRNAIEFLRNTIGQKSWYLNIVSVWDNVVQSKKGENHERP